MAAAAVVVVIEVPIPLNLVLSTTTGGCDFDWTQKKKRAAGTHRQIDSMAAIVVNELP